MDSKSSATYIERAIQTENPRHIPHSDNDKALNLHEPLSPKNVDAAYSQISSLAISKRNYKLSQLAYNKPSELIATEKRIVSLPETSPPSRIKSDTIRDRVVSMTEQVKVSLTSSDADNSLSSDCFETSIDTSQSQLSDLGNLSTRRTRPRNSSTYPQTPSPPSSPESIMIIGNNTQVPNSFLRRNVTQLPKALHVDSNDWRTWTSSPPRPIPALHGPLSLPYARCPSGAEGTIIEGEDMTRTIWGLGHDASARDHDPDPKADLHPVPAQKLDIFPRTELPTRFRALSNTPVGLTEPPNIFGKPLSDDSLYVSPSIPVIDDLHLHQFPDKLRHLKGRNSVQGLGLGCWTDNQSPNSNLEGINDHPHLKASAPEFVPRGRLSEDPQTRVNVDPPVRSHYIVPKPQVPAFDLAFEYRAQQEGKTPLLASPSSTSSTWSPYLPTPLLAHTERLADVWNSDDVADELRRFVFERIGQQNLSPADLKQISELARSINLDRIPIYSSSGHDRLFTTPKYSPESPPLNFDLHHPGPPPNTPLPQIPSQRSRPVPSNSIPIGSRQNTQPRSVPFARLLQRRLSVVPEEPSPIAEHPPTSPRIERTAFGGAEAQHYKPYFAHAGSQISRLPDISDHVVGRSQLNSHSSSSGGAPFTAGNLEVGEYIQLGPRMNSTNSGYRAAKSFSQGGIVSDGVRERSSKPRTTTAAHTTSSVTANKENNLAIGRSGSTDSTRSGKLLVTAGKETTRKKSKSKVKKQEHNVTHAGSSVPSEDTWVSGPELDAWLA
ncbi:hypothetical protein F5890DRAFT_1582419 [Lentinula detonsa]|uniref:Uncharacterized protein n=1 Tax=Lentinula detonsa TaxID=2804962 RepID=A0AA38Q9T7_9AGAR|nr:hypothetical protein F5890DRAFT_1582419 [Lentinula detonsa]